MTVTPIHASQHLYFGFIHRPQVEIFFTPELGGMLLFTRTFRIPRRETALFPSLKGSPLQGPNHHHQREHSSIFANQKVVNSEHLPISP